MAVAKCMISKKPREENKYSDRIHAAKILNGVAYKLYTYLESQENTEFLYERNLFIQTINTTAKSANAAFDELVENNFLVQKNELTYYFLTREKNT